MVEKLKNKQQATKKKIYKEVNEKKNYNKIERDLCKKKKV